MLSITTDVEKKMTGHIQGVATRFEQAVLLVFFRIWCGLHQLDLVLWQFYTELMDKSFYGIFTISSHICDGSTT
jgi:fumarate reductase subunit D